MKWEDALLRVCHQARIRGGEVKIVFIRRDKKVIPVISSYIDNKVYCDEETVPIDD